MPSYYKQIQIINEAFEKQIIAAGPAGVDMKLILYEFTRQLPVSKSHLLKRLEDMQEIGYIKIQDNMIYWIRDDKKKQ